MNRYRVEYYNESAIPAHEWTLFSESSELPIAYLAAYDCQANDVATRLYDRLTDTYLPLED